MSTPPLTIFGRRLERQADGNYVTQAGPYRVVVAKTMVVNGNGVGDGWCVRLEHASIPIIFGLRATIEVAIENAEKTLMSYAESIAEVLEQ